MGDHIFFVGRNETHLVHPSLEQLNKYFTQILITMVESKPLERMHHYEVT